MTTTHVQEAYMGNNNTGTEETNQPAEEVEGQEPEETTEGEQPDNEQTEETSEEQEQNEESEETELSREDALAALAKTRKSEAKYRTRLREAEQKLENAKTPEEVEAAIAEIKQANAKDTRDLLVENVALKHGLPDDLVETLKAFSGETREDFETHAKVLAKYASTEAGDPEVSGGLDPNEGGDDFDPKAEAKKMRRQRRRGR